jgi:catechol 2,3-dioxygenase-like lactoylglutathione lyase family enzyme
MLGTEKIIAFVATCDPKRAKAFYRETLGLRLISEDGFALVFDAVGTMLRVSVVPRVVVAPYTVVGWQVVDIRKVAQSLNAANVHGQRYPGLDQDDDGVWTAPGGPQILWFKDPDGNTLSATQF